MRSSMLSGIVLALCASTLSAQELFDRDLGTNLGLGDESTVPALPLAFAFPYGGFVYGSVSVCSNGYVWLGPVAIGGSDPTPTELELGSQAARIAPLWSDYDPSAPGSGNVWFESLPDRAVISWAAVYEKGTTNPVNFQLTLFATGHVDVAFGRNVGPSPVVLDRLIGASPGGGAVVGAVDFAVHPFLTTNSSFAQRFTGNSALPIEDIRFNWSQSFPGYAVSHVPVTINELPPPARIDLVGTGCAYRGVTLYELSSGSASTPAGVLRFDPNGLGGYVVSRQLQRPPALGAEFNLPAGNDTLHPVLLPFSWPHALGAIDRIVVSSNGYVTLGALPAPTNSPSPVLAEFLNGPARIAGLWTDLDPSSGGTVSTTSDPQRGSFAITWSQVPSNPNTGSNTFRIELFQGGSFTIDLPQSIATNGVASTLVGYTDGHGARDPGSSPLATMPMPVDLGEHVDPLTLVGQPNTSPVIGSTFVSQVSNLRGLLCFLVIGTEGPPMDLALMGAPGCTVYVDMFGQISYVNVVFGTTFTDFGVEIPLSIDLAGVQLMTQAAGDDLLANPLGWSTSNGARWTVGL